MKTPPAPPDALTYAEPLTRGKCWVCGRVAPVRFLRTLFGFRRPVCTTVKYAVPGKPVQVEMTTCTTVTRRPNGGAR